MQHPAVSWHPATAIIIAQCRSFEGVNKFELQAQPSHLLHLKLRRLSAATWLMMNIFKMD